MRTTTYIFGNFSDGYSQYPDNYTRDLFSSLAKSRKGTTELIYHREGSLTYYIYTREISRSDKTFIGLCYVFNDILITDFSYLFDIFEDTITHMVVRGELLEFTNEGNLSTHVNQLYSNSEELQHISDYINSKLSTIGRYAEKLPVQNFSVSSSEWRNFSFDELAAVNTVIKNYSNIRVIKGDNYDTESLKGYASKLKANNEEIKTLTNKIAKNEEEISRLKRQKKQFSAVIILVIIIAIGLVFFTARMNDKNEIIMRQNKNIAALEDYTDRLKSDSVNLATALSLTRDTLRLTKKTLHQLRRDYSTLETERNDLYAQTENQRQKISSLQNRNEELERKISNMRNSNSAYSSTTYAVGASTGRSINGYDASYALWLYARKSLRINYFYVLPNNSGYITFGLYNQYGSLVSSYRTYVSSNQWNKVEVNFELSSYTTYYLALRDANGISLSYHSSDSEEYANYQKGSLQLLGASPKGNSEYKTKYYQYFYHINYSLKN
ncbi:MAG: hypothetical protein IJ838_02060 [Paludibacteraceae bacterium]|nr:hypothetical protein [Paludibacteraceae bacterium]